MNEKQKLEKQLNVRISDDLHRRAKAKAAMTGRPLVEVVQELLSNWVNKTPTPTK